MTRHLYFLLSSCFFLFIGSTVCTAHTPDVQPALPGQFRPMDNRLELAIATDSLGNTWIRGTVPTRLRGAQTVLRIPSAGVHDYRLYMAEGDRLTPIAQDSGNHSGALRTRFPQYTFAARDSVFYLETEGPAPRLPEVQLLEHNRFVSAEYDNLLRIGFYYGLAFMSLIFNVVFYLIFRDRRFVTYCFLLFFTFISFFYEDGMFYYFSGGRWTMDYLMIWNNAITAIVAVPFTYYFLDLNTTFERFKKWFIVLSAVMLAGALIYTLTDSPAISVFVYALCFLFPSSCLYLAVRRFRHDVYARFLVLTFTLVVATGLLYVLYTHVDSSAFTWFGIHTFRLVSAVEIIAISFAIIFKVRTLQHENDRYREELNNYLKTLEVNTAEAKPIMADALKTKYDLTEREAEVLLCIWDGLTNKEIAERLFITVSTAKYHVSNLYIKLDVKNRNQVQVLRESLWANGALKVQQQ